MELPTNVHPYFVATQAHPELRSRPTRPHPLFAGLVGAALARRELLADAEEVGAAQPALAAVNEADVGDDIVAGTR